ncbi:MAG: aminotransferase class III-fold pyridoxal phosphate-dependent enzyme [Candidatus Aminicenantes bacterium]|nr:aminotransferase class III-fold pyridoxal phosphate-dependent enzyme [Candidatus Aminicenantes bacterium]
MEDSGFLQKKAQNYIPGGCSTEEKTPRSLYASDWGPFYVKSALGAEIWDLDGHRFIDFGMGLGSCLLGYNHPVVVDAITNELKKAIVSTLSSPLEPRLAELIGDMFPSIEQTRFLKTGAEACSAAIRLARAYTYREIILASGYFGWHDWSNKDAGVPVSTRNLCVEFLFNDSADFLEKFDRLPESPAAVVLEPVMGEAPGREFLKTIRDLCTKCGIVLIFDECKTGARLAPGGAQEYYSFTPDLTVLGKGLAGGMPLSAVGGKRDIMDTWRKLWISSTLAGESLSLAAGLATLKFVRDNPVNEHIRKVGTILLEGFREIAKDFPHICDYSGIPHMSSIGLKQDLPNLKKFEEEFYQEILKSGFLIVHKGYNFPSFSHTDQQAKHCVEVLHATFERIGRRI